MLDKIGIFEKAVLDLIVEQKRRMKKSCLQQSAKCR